MTLLRCLLTTFALGGALLLITACEVETDFVTGDAVQLRFSTDTISFDTVFTDVGSATQIMTVYNDASDPVKIDRIAVEGMTGVTYNFNVDGFQGPVAEEVIIWGGDSIFVFVEVEVDPTAPEEISPFIAEDLLNFEMGNSVESVVLQAFGQNAFYVNGFRRGGFLPINCDGGIAQFPQDLPTVIYGSLFIDSCIVQALPGTRIYFHGGVQRNDFFGGSGFFNDGFVFTLPNGSLQLLGTREEPVIVRTDRLEQDFLEDAGLYRGFIFGPGSRNNRLEFTEVYNSIAAITVDSAAEVTIENSTIAYTGGPAINVTFGTVAVRNSLIHSSFGNAVQYILGGNLTMEHTTVASYGVDRPAMVLTNFDCDEDDNCLIAPLRANISNSILAGSLQDELVIADLTNGEEPGFFELDISNTVVKTSDELLRRQDGLFAAFYENICRNCVNTDFGDTLFVAISEDDYRLDSLSVARNLGVFDPDLPVDLLGNARVADSTDAGAFEFVAGQ